jgi:two-component system, OmpR family, response regulator VicR
MAKLPNRKTTYTSGDVARLLNINPRTARLYLTQGRIKGTRNPVTGTWTVTHQAVSAFLEERGVEPSAIGFPVKVLIVDDEPAVLKSIEAILGSSMWNFVFETSTDGYEALIRLGQRAPDLIILDSRMPNVDGKQVLQAIRNQRNVARTKILIVTAHPEDVDELLRVGAHDALLKPFEPQQLIEKVTSLLPHSKLAKARIS